VAEQNALGVSYNKKKEWKREEGQQKEGEKGLTSSALQKIRGTSERENEGM
jgi:hypothetical protein